MGDRRVRDRAVLSRRKLLASLTVGASGTALAGCESETDESTGRSTGESPTPTPTPSERSGRVQGQSTPTRRQRLAERYGTVVDLAEAGASPEGDRDLVPFLESYAGDDTLLYLPEGRYLIDDWFKLHEFEDFAIYGEEATLVPAADYSDKPILVLGGTDRARGLHVEGIAFDFRNHGYLHQPLKALVTDGLAVQDVSVAGASGGVRVEVTSPEGTGRVRNLQLPNGRYSGSTGCYVGKPHRGELTLEGCYIAGYPGNGIYASNANGPVRVLGGTFVNNGIASVRLPANSLVRGATVECDTTDPLFRNMRGIWVRGPNTTVENCSVTLRRVTGSDGGIVTASTTQVRDTEIRVDADDVYAILGNDTSAGAGSDGDRSRFENVRISGEAGGSDTVYMIGQEGCRFENVTISQTGPDRNGIHFYRTADATVRESRIDVTGEAIVSEESNVRMHDVETSAIGRPVEREEQ